MAIGFRLVRTNTYQEWIWGEEVYINSLAETIAREFGSEVHIKDMEGNFPAKTDVVISLAPYTDGVPLTIDALNVLWLQFPGSLKMESEFKLTEYPKKYDYVLFASKKIMRLADSPGNSEVLYVPANSEQYYPRKMDKGRNVVFVGNYHPNIRGDKTLERYVAPALDFGLEIFGFGWQKAPKIYRNAWCGAAHPSEVPTIYSGAKIVLSVHGEKHHAYEMPNSRVMEASACGTCIISDEFDEVRCMFGDSIIWTQGYSDTHNKLEKLLADNEYRKELGRQSLRVFLDKYDAKHAAAKIVNVVKKLLLMHNK